MNYAVFLSGGIGSRVGRDIPKQYIRAGKHMMASYSLKTLIDCEYIERICIVADQNWRKELADDILSIGVSIEKIVCYAEPGENRQLSAFNGMNELLKISCYKSHEIPLEDTVLVHDAARPFLSEELLAACYRGLEGHDGVMPVLPMKDTVYLSDDGERVAGLLDRKKIFAGQAPELFRFKLYYEANKELVPERIRLINGASEPAIMYGMDIAMVPGDEKNFKVTTAEDLRCFNSMKGS